MTVLRGEVADQLAATIDEDRWPVGEARPILLANVGGEPSHAAVVREHGPADRCAGGGDRVEEGYDTAKNQADQGWGSERCFSKWLKRSNFPIPGFSGGAELALGRTKRRACAVKIPRPSTLEDQKLAVGDMLPRSREPKWKSRFSATPL